MIATRGKSVHVAQIAVLGLIVGAACYWATLQMLGQRDAAAPSTPTVDQEIIVKPGILTPANGATLSAVPEGMVLSSSFRAALRDSTDGAAYYTMNGTPLQSTPAKRLTIEVDVSPGPTAPAQAFEFRFVQNGLKASQWYTFAVRPMRDLYTALYELSQDHRELAIDTIWLRGDSVGLGGSIIVHGIRFHSNRAAAQMREQQPG